MQTPLRSLVGLGAAGILIGAWSLPALAQGEERTKPALESLAITEERLVALGPRVERDEKVARLAAGARVRALRLAPVQIDKDERAVAPAVRVEVFLVTYPTNVGIRAVVDLGTGEVLEAVRMPGRPQASEAERQEGEARVRAYESLEPLFKQGAHAVGGFAVEAPPGAPQGRYLEFHVVDRERTRILREVFVDVASGRVVVGGTEERP